MAAKLYVLGAIRACPLCRLMWNFAAKCDCTLVKANLFV